MLESNFVLRKMMWRLLCGRVVTLLVILFVGCCWASETLGSSSTCLKQCICKWKGGKESVTCHQAGLQEVPASGLEATIQVLDLSGNPLMQLGANQFRKLGLTHLQRVILQRCALRHIDGTSFAGLTNLVELDLSHNAMSSIPVQAFQHIPELRELKLNGNPLIRLAGQPFAAATKLVRLEIANCQLNHLDQKAFHGLELLEWLRLDGNLIEVLPTTLLSPLRTLRGIDLHHNPWNCTCPLRPLRSWLAARNMPFSVPPLCLFPIRLRGQSWNRMPLEELACPPKIHAVESLVQVTVGQQANLSCHVTSNPEAAVSWFFADRLIVNLTMDDNPAQQIYYVREQSDKMDKMDKTSVLVLASAREQDSGFYVCQAINRAEKVSTNITLLVKSNGIDLAAGQLSRGLTAGLILAVFAMLIIVLLVCCLCSLKRARMHASLRNRRTSSVVSSMRVPSMNGSLKQDQQLDPFLRRQSTEIIHKHNGGGSVFKTDSVESAGHPEKIETRFQDKQWLVNNQPAEVVKEEEEEIVCDGHRQIAMYQNKVKFNADAEIPPRPILKVCSPVRNYPDLLPDYESDVTSIQDEMELVQAKRGGTVFPASRYFQQHGGRRRLSDWEVHEVEDSPGYESEMSHTELELVRRHSEDFDEDFHRRYAYHTDQLNRFLSEYRALQKRLAQMQDTWGRCLENDEPVRHHHQRPLRPILKNRLPPSRPATTRWEQEPDYEVSSVVDELYYS